MKVKAKNTRGTFAVLSIHGWDIMFSYGDPVAAHDTRSGQLYREGGDHTKSTRIMTREFFTEVLGWDPEKDDWKFINTEDFEKIVMGKFEVVPDAPS